MILGIQLIMIADCNKYCTLIKDYDREYLGGVRKYPKTLQDAYNLLKGRNKHTIPGQKYQFRVELSSTTMSEQTGQTLVNDGTRHPLCSRCGCTNHTSDTCVTSADGTMLHTVREIEEVEYEINNEASTYITANKDKRHCHSNGLIFTQPEINSLMDQSNTSSKTVRIPNRWILLDSQSIL